MDLGPEMIPNRGNKRSTKAGSFRRAWEQRFDELSIKQKLMLIIMGPSAAVLMLLCVAMMIFDLFLLSGFLQDDLRRTAALTAYDCGRILLECVVAPDRSLEEVEKARLANRDKASIALRKLDVNKRVVAACLYTADGRAWASYSRDRHIQELPSAPPPWQGEYFPNRYELFYPIMHDDIRLGTLYLKTETQGVSSRMRGYFFAVIVIMMSCGCFAYFLSASLQRVISNPVLRLAAMAKLISREKNYSIRAVKSSNDEIGLLIDQFNEMLSQIQERDNALQQAHDHLEDRVADRTAELEQEIQERERIEGSLQQEVAQHKITERKLQAAKEDAESANRAKSDFLASMSHEIRTPMNGVMGMIELLLNTELTAPQRKYAETVRRSGRALLAVIGDILDYSKIEAGRLTLEPIPFDLEVAAEDVVELLTPIADDKSLALILRYAPDAPRRFVGDVGRIRQVLTNLVGNALKFTEKGHVFINILCETQAGDTARMRISVTDSGIGIPEKKLADIFAKFEQAGQSKSRKYGGTGLGLSISKEFVILMGGKIGVQSEEGEGSTFYFIVPLPLDKQAAEEPGPDIDLDGLHLLVVSDNPVHRPVLHELFSMWGIRCRVVPSGEGAVKRLRQAQVACDPYQILFVDCQTSADDAERLARAIKRDMLISDTILVLLTSLGQRGDARRMAELGYAAYLSRPMRHSELRDALATLWQARTTGKPLGLVTRHTVAEARETPEALRLGKQLIRLKVLVAEDNAVNQQVAYEILNSLGCTVHIATDGDEAIEMQEASPYDVIFMDCQMPRMDGFTATEELRHREDGQRHVPIIAMTAHAMVGDRERCLQAGMDDYISKPIDPDSVMNALKRCLQLDANHAAIETAAPAEPAPPDDGPSSLPVIDAQQALWITGGRVDMLRRLLEVFLNTTPERLAELQQAVEAGNAVEIDRVGHSMKGASASVGAKRFNKIAFDIEQCGKREDVAGAVSLMQDLLRAFDELKVTLHEFDWEQAARSMADTTA